MTRWTLWLSTTALLFAANTASADTGQRLPPTATPWAGHYPATPMMAMPPWVADTWRRHRRTIAQQRTELRQKRDAEREAQRDAIQEEREAWLQRWARERAQAREERRAREEAYLEEQAERFPHLMDYRKRHAAEFERRWREIQERLERRRQAIEEPR